MHDNSVSSEIYLTEIIGWKVNIFFVCNIAFDFVCWFVMKPFRLIAKNTRCLIQEKNYIYYKWIPIRYNNNKLILNRLILNTGVIL